jgi:hypothetical protein
MRGLNRSGTRWLWRLVALAAALLFVVSANAAQFGQRGGGRPGGGGRGGRGGDGGGRGDLTPNGLWNRYVTMQDFDGSFQFCRLQFRNGSNGDGNGWGVDWPRADQNLSIRLSELTRTPVSMDASNNPNSVLLTAVMPEISHCPFVMMTEPGGAFFDDQEALALKTYLLKGGFLWADDFWGEYAWQYWESQIRKVFPSGQYPIFDVPLTHPIFTQMMTVPKIPQIPSIGFWERSRSTSERGPDSAVPQVRAINDDRGRIMVLMTHNTDFGDAYEREGDDHEYFEKFSVPGYAFGVNVLLYVMTH